MPVPPEDEEEKETEDLEWELLVLSSPTKVTGGQRKTIVDQLNDDYEEVSVPSSSSDRSSITAMRVDIEGSKASKLYPKPARLMSFSERLRGAADDDA